MAVIDLEKPVRHVLAINYIPGFALCLASGIVSNNVTTPLAILPMTGSLVMSLLHIYMRRYTGVRLGQSHPMYGPVADNGFSKIISKLWDTGYVPFILDSLVFAIMTVLLVFTWLEIDHSSCWDGQRVALVCYATFPMIITWLAHLLLALARFGQVLVQLGHMCKTRAPGSAPESTCPHCNAHRYRDDDAAERGSTTNQMRQERGFIPSSPQEREGLLSGGQQDADAMIRPSGEHEDDGSQKSA